MRRKRMSLASLAELWRIQKDAENSARETRLQIEAQITELVEGPDEGTVHGFDGKYDVSVTRKRIYTVDEEVYDEMVYQIPPALDPVRWKPELNLARFRALESTAPEVYRACQNFLTAKPAKPSVKVEEVVA